MMVAQYATFQAVPVALEPAWVFGKYVLRIGGWTLLWATLVVQLPTIVKILVAPRVYLLDTLLKVVQ